MAILATTRVTTRVPALAVPVVATLAVVAGIALGVGDLELQLHLAYPWAGLANESGIWAAAAFVLGAGIGPRPVLAAVAGILLETVAVEAYYLAGVVQLHDDVSTLTDANAVAWLVFGIVAGAGFGVAGAWVRTPGWLAALGLAAGAAILLAQAALVYPDRTAPVTAAAALVVLACGVRRPWSMLAAAVLTLPLTLLCYTAFTAVGFSH